MEKLLLMEMLMVLAVVTTIHSLRYEAWKRKPFLRNSLHSLCGISFVKIYKLCCDKPEKCRFKNKLTMGYSNDIGASDKETFLKWIKDDINTLSINENDAHKFLKDFKKPKRSIYTDHPDQDNATEECCYERCNLNEVVEYCH